MDVCTLRNLVGLWFSKLEYGRRLATRYDKSKTVSPASPA